MGNHQRKLKDWSRVLMIITVAFSVMALTAQTTAAQTITDLSPASNTQADEGQVVTFTAKLNVPQDVGGTMSLYATNNAGTPLPGFPKTMSRTGGDTTNGFDYAVNYMIPWDYVVNPSYGNGHANLRWMVVGDLPDGRVAPAVDSSENVLIINEADPPPSAFIEVKIAPDEASAVGTYSITGPGGTIVSGTALDKTYEIDGINDPFGTYNVIFTDAAGYLRTIAIRGGFSESPAGTATGPVQTGDTIQISAVYVPVGSLKVITEMTEGDLLIPNGGGWDLTSAPGGFAGSPTMKMYDGSVYTGDSVTISPAIAGEYTVTGKFVSGWHLSYAPQSGNLVGGSDLTLKVQYTRDRGNLIINVVNGTPAYTLPGGAGWEINDAPGDYGGSTSGNASGLNIGNAPGGDYTVDGKNVNKWHYSVGVNPVGPGVAPSVIDGQQGTLVNDGSLTFTITYARNTGTLVINVVNGSSGDYPTLPSGAGWMFVDDEFPGDYPAPPKPTSGDASGLNDPEAPTGNYTVTGKNIDHWYFTTSVDVPDVSVSPSDHESHADVYDDETTTFTVTYKRETGYLQVFTETFDGRNLPVGAGWMITEHDPGDYIGDTQQIYNSNESSPQNWDDEAAATGIFTLTGKPVVGWTFDVSIDSGEQENIAPSGEVEEGELYRASELIFTVTYTINRYEVGAIYWDPVNAVEVPGGSITPGTTGVEHGETQDFTATTLPTNYALTGTSSFTGTSIGTSVDTGTGVATVSGVGSDGTLRIDVELQQGELEVIILPESIRPLAGWRQPGQLAYKPSSPAPGGVENLVPGFYDVEFADVDGWFTPSAQVDVQIFPNAKTTITAIYTEEPSGSLQVFIEDNFDDRVNGLGAQWQPTFPAGSEVGAALADTWYNSGDIITGLEPGSVGIRFKTLAGWVLPELSSATIQTGKMTRETGEYYRVLIIHKSDYNGDGTDDLAVFDHNSSTWSVASIGKPASAPSAVNLFETKFGKSNDIPTAGDYDGDGVADLAYWREKTGEWRVNKQFKLKNFGQVNDIPIPGDYDGDGMTDPALFRPSTGEWIIYNRQTQETTTVSFGDFGDVPVPGNFDADALGMTDLAVFNVETGKWRVAIFDANKEQWVEKKKVRVNGKRIRLRDSHGPVGSVPVQADYDGDGATDLAVYMRRSSTWNVRDQFEIELGVHGDVPVPNDWAGLGHVIPTIFHPKNGRWLAIDNLLRTKHGSGGQPLMSGR